MDGEIRTASLFAIHSAEKKCKTKIRTTAKLQNYPPQNSLKLPLPICKKFTVLKHRRYFQIEKYIQNRQSLAWFSYKSRSFILSISRYSQSITKEYFCDFRYKFIEKLMVKVKKKSNNYYKMSQNIANFKTHVL